MENKAPFPIRALGTRASPGCDGTKPVERYKAFCTVICTVTGHIRSRLARNKQPWVSIVQPGVGQPCPHMGCDH